MTKKKFELTSDIIEVSKPENSIPQDNSLINERIGGSQPVNDMVNLTLRVPRSFSKEYKSWCATKGLTMNQVIQIMFQMYKKDFR